MNDLIIQARSQIIGYNQAMVLSRLATIEEETGLDEAALKVECCSECGYYFDQGDVVPDLGSGYQCRDCANG